jgi:Sec-independent protein translocase protein TatA
MNILGMGTMEILVILLVAFIVLGPERMTSTAKLLGKATREMRRLTQELPSLTLDEEPAPSSERPSSHRAAAPRFGSPDTSTAEEPAPDGHAPVPFDRSGSPAGQDEAERPQQQGKP